MDSIPVSGRCPGEGNGYSLQYSCLDNPVDGGACLALVPGVTKSQTRLSDGAHSSHVIHCYVEAGGCVRTDCVHILFFNGYFWSLLTSSHFLKIPIDIWEQRQKEETAPTNNERKSKDSWDVWKVPFQTTDHELFSSFIF